MVSSTWTAGWFVSQKVLFQQNHLRRCFQKILLDYWIGWIYQRLASTNLNWSHCRSYIFVWKWSATNWHYFHYSNVFSMTKNVLVGFMVQKDCVATVVGGAMNERLTKEKLLTCFWIWSMFHFSDKKWVSLCFYCLFFSFFFFNDIRIVLKMIS